MYILGVPMAYANIRTLLDDSVRNCQGDFAAYRPTLMGGVPAVFEMIRKGMMKKINEAGPIVGGIFAAAVIGKQTLPWPLKSVIDRVLFARVKQATGGRLRIAVCGGTRFEAGMSLTARRRTEQRYPVVLVDRASAYDAGFVVIVWKLMLNTRLWDDRDLRHDEYHDRATMVFGQCGRPRSIVRTEAGG